MNHKKSLKMNGATAHFRDDNIIHLHYEGVQLSLEDAKSIISSLLKESPWTLCPIYISADPFSAHDNDAQKYLSGEDVMLRSSAIAVLAKNLAQKIAINFFIKIQKPTKPTRFFTSEKEAINWLRKFETINK